MKNNKQKIIFPADTSDIISELTKKYGLQESTKEFFDKFKKGHDSNGRKMAKIIVAIKQGALQQKNLAQEFARTLSLNKRDAINLANEIKNRILAQNKIRKRTNKETIKKQKNNKKIPDTYRESII
jgi:hypothetical protein